MSGEPREKIEKLLLGAEATIHRAGWDQPPFLAGLHWQPSGRLALIQNPTEIGNPPGHFIETLGRAVHDDDGFRQALKDRDTEGFYGMAFVCEAWQSTETDPEKMRELHHSGKSLADIPGSVEVRMIAAVDLHARVHYVQRVRGQKPVNWVRQAGGQLGGRVIEGLRLLTLTIAEAMPNGAEYVEALSRLSVKQVDDLD